MTISTAVMVSVGSQSYCISFENIDFHLFLPTALAVEVIELDPRFRLSACLSVRLSVCQHSHGQTLWPTSNCSNRRARTYIHTHKQTHLRYQMHYLPCFAVNNYSYIVQSIVLTWLFFALIHKALWVSYVFQVYTNDFLLICLLCTYHSFNTGWQLALWH